MIFEDYVAAILDVRKPRAALKQAPELGPARLTLWTDMVDAYLARGMNDRFSEARVAADFSGAQLQQLKRLSEEDFSRVLDSEKLFSSIGVPDGVGARRVWLGFDQSIELARPWPVEYQGSTRQGTLWQAIYVAYWWEEKGNKVKELLSQLPPEQLFDFFYRWDEMTFDKKDLFCEAITEYGRELLPKYLKTPTQGLVDWAEGRLAGIWDGRELEPETRDNWLVLAVLGTQLGKKGTHRAEAERLLTLGVPTILDGATGKKVWTAVPEEWRLRYLERKLAPFLTEASPPPLSGQWFTEFKELPLGAMKLSDAERLIIYRAAVRAWELDEAVFAWETAFHLQKAGLELVTSTHGGSAAERGLRDWIAAGYPSGDIERTKQSSTYVIVEPGHLSELSAVERAQLVSVGQHYLGRSGTEEEIVRWALERFIMFGFVKLMNRRGQRVGDAWFGFVRGRRFVGYLFEADQTDPLPDIHLGSGDLVGRTRPAHVRAQLAGVKVRTSSWTEDRTAAARAALGL